MANDDPSTHDANPEQVGSLLDDWRAEVGDEEIVRIVDAIRRDAAAIRRDAAAGLIPAFTDRDELLAHWSDRAHRPA